MADPVAEWLKAQPHDDVEDWLKDQHAVETPDHPGPAAPPQVDVKPDTSLLGRIGSWNQAHPVSEAAEKGVEGFNDALNAASDKLHLPHVESVPYLGAAGRYASDAVVGGASMFDPTPANIATAMPAANGPRLVKAAAEAARGAIAGSGGGESKAGGEVGGAVGAAIPFIGPYVSRAITATKNNPIVQRSIEYLENNGVPMTLGQRTGRPVIARAEQHIPDLIGGGGAKDFTNQQQDQVAGVLGSHAAQVSPVNASDVAAGQNMQGKLAGDIAGLKSQADQEYGAIRQKLAQNPTTVQTGTQTSPLIDPSTGKPMVTPTYTTFQAPVDMNAVRARLAPIYNEIAAAMPPGKRDYSQAFADLKRIMETQDSHMSAMDVDKGLSAIKTFIRNGQDSPYLTGKAQATAMQTVGQIESEFNNALQKIDPKLPAQMQHARSLVRSYHTIDDVLSDLPQEPAQLYKALTVGDDRAYNTLQKLNKIAPAEVKTVGRTYLQGLLEKATAEGGFQRAAGVLADWNRLGDQAKQTMFGPQMTSDLDKIFVGAKHMFPAEGSKTWHNAATTASWLGLGHSVLEMMQGLATGHMATAGIGAAAAAAQVGGTYALSRILFNPVGAHYLQQALTQTPGSQAWRAAIGILNAKIDAVNRQQQKHAGATDSW